MANGTPINVEAALASAVRVYLSGKPNQKISEDESLRRVCQPLGRLLQNLLMETDEWSKYDWIDDVLPCTVDRPSSNNLVLTGLLVWLGGTKRAEWKEPLLASIQLPTSSSSKLSYELRLGDADRGLGKCAYSVPHDFPYVPVGNWMFTFISS